MGPGLWRDDDVAQGSVRLERNQRGRIELYADATTARHLLDGVAWQPVLDLLAEVPEGIYALPAQHAPAAVVPEELIDLVGGLRLAERGYSAYCAFGPCVLAANSMVAGYSLCQHHADELTGHERHVA